MSYPHLSQNLSQEFEMPSYGKKRKSSTIAKALKRYRAANKPYAQKSTVKSRSVAPYTRGLSAGYFRSHQAAFPQRYNEILRDYQQKTITPGAGTFTVPTILAVNNPYDVAVGFSQPSGWAKLMAIYTKCYVKSAKVTCMVTNETSSTLGSAPSLQGLSITTLQAPVGSASLAIQGGLETHAQVNKSPDIITMTLSVDIGKYLTVDNVLDGDQLFCTDAAGPQQVVYIQHWCFNNGGIAGSYLIHYIIDYDCIFSDPRVIV